MTIILNAGILSTGGTKVSKTLPAQDVQIDFSRSGSTWPGRAGIKKPQQLLRFLKYKSKFKLLLIALRSF